MLKLHAFSSRPALRALVAMFAIGAALCVATRAEAQTLSLTGGMTLLLGPPTAQDQALLGAPQGGGQAPPQQPQQPQTVYIVETQAPVGYGQPTYGQPTYGQPGSMGVAAQASQEAQAESDGRILRIVMEPVMAIAVGWAVGVIGLVVGMNVGGCFDDSGTTGSCIIGAVTGLYTGLLVGIPLGVIWAGSWYGGMGSYGSAFLGTLAGTGVAVLLAALIQDTGTAAGLSLLPIAGAVVGYELSSSSNGHAATAGLAFAPTFDHGVVTGGTAGVRLAF